MVGNFVQNTAFVCCIYSLKMESHTVDGSACHDEGPDKWVFFLFDLHFPWHNEQSIQYDKDIIQLLYT